MKKYEWDRWCEIFEMEGGWASVPLSLMWQKPFRFMGPIELVERKPFERKKLMYEYMECELLKETEKAWLVVIDNEKYWMPKSRCEFSDGALKIEAWLWIKKQQEKDQEIYE